MRLATTALLLSSLCAHSAIAQPAAAPAKPPLPNGRVEAEETLGPDSERQPNVPQGKLFNFKFENSKIFPGTIRTISVYIPAQYKADKPACLYVGFDGLGFNAPVVFDNLIHKGEMPVTIGVGVSPGEVSSAQAAPPAPQGKPQASSINPRFNRSLEFDSLTPDLARLVIDEVLPEVEKRQTPDGQPIRLSKDPNDRSCGGGSTGGIAAFTLAWERPDSFRRVYTAVGTFVGMRGGDHYAVLVRKTEPKPIRLFMQDGASDQWMGGPEVGDWWMSNQTMERALTFAGYAVDHAWGHGDHGSRHGAVMFPDGMRFLWKDYPRPVTAGESQNLFLKAMLAPGQTWAAVDCGDVHPIGVVTAPGGQVIVADADGRRTVRITPDGKASPADQTSPAGHPVAFGPDGRSFVVDGDVLRIADPRGEQVFAFDDLRAAGVTVTDTGAAYVTDPARDRLLLIDPAGKMSLASPGLSHPTGVARSPDGLWLAVAEGSTHWAYSFRVKPDGTLDARQRFYRFEVPDWADDAGVTSICFDTDGRLYAATRIGVQVMDRNGRVRAILPLPDHEQVTGICFGGTKSDILYANTSKHVFRRTMKSTGAIPWAPPAKLPGWGAG